MNTLVPGSSYTLSVLSLWRSTTWGWTAPGHKGSWGLEDDVPAVGTGLTPCPWGGNPASMHVPALDWLFSAWAATLSWLIIIVFGFYFHFVIPSVESYYPKRWFLTSEEKSVPNSDNEVLIHFLNNHIPKNFCHMESTMWEDSKDVGNLLFLLIITSG